MRILVVDDELIALNGLTRTVREAMPEAEVSGFREPWEVLEFAENHSCDVAMLDIRLRGGLQGLDLAKRLRELWPEINIIFTTGYSEYMSDAFALHASGYLQKPITEEMVKRELSDLRRPVKAAEKKELRVHCFGNFEIYLEGSPVKFSYGKTRELFAYLVDRRGASVNGDELIAVLWEDCCGKNTAKSYLRNLWADLKDGFGKLGVQDVLVKGWNSYAIDPEAFWCDLYEFDKGDPEAVRLFQGEYMAQYSWGEFRIGELIRAQKNAG